MDILSNDEMKEILGENISDKLIGVRAKFKDSAQIRFSFDTIIFRGFCYNNSCFVYTYSNYSSTTEKLIQTLLSNFTVPYSSLNTHTLHKLILSLFPPNDHKTRLYSFGFKVSHRNVSFNEYYSGRRTFKGTAILNNIYAYEIVGTEFDVNGYKTNTKIFGVFSAICFLATFYGWMFLIGGTTQSQLHKLSVDSFLMHMSFDFIYSLFIMEVSLKYGISQNVILILSITMIGFYFIVQINFTTFIWRSSIANVDIEFNEMRAQFLNFLFKMVFVLMATQICFTLIFNYPFIVLLILYSGYIPQIIHSAIKNTTKSIDPRFVMFTMWQKLLILFYYFINNVNISDTYDVTAGLVVFFYYMLQIIIMLLQNVFGGAFFIPMKERPGYFDYTSGVVEPGTICSICLEPIQMGDKTMVTPCEHAFHEECLQRWMNEELICPVCRATLPELP